MGTLKRERGPQGEAVSGGEVYRRCFWCDGCSTIWHVKSLLKSRSTGKILCPGCVAEIRGKQQLEAIAREDERRAKRPRWGRKFELRRTPKPQRKTDDSTM